MIQYIVAAGVGALLGSSTKKGRKSYAKGGQLAKRGNFRIFIYDNEDTILHAFSRFYKDISLDTAISIARRVCEEQGYGYATLFNEKLAGRGVDGEVGSVSIKDDWKFKPNPMYGEPLIRDFAKGGQTDKGLEQSLKRFEEIRRASELSDAQARQRRRLRQHQTGMSAGAFAKGGEVTTDEALAKAEYLEDYGVDAEQLDDQYLGEWDSPEDFVESWIDDTGGMEGLIDPERFYEIDRIGFRDWAMGMAEAMSDDIDENNADEYAERLDLEMEYSDAVDEDKLDDFIQTLQEKEAEAVYDDFMTNYTTADEIINDLGPNYGMSLDELESNYLIQPDYTAIADAFEDDGYVYIKKGGKTFVFNYNMKRGGRTKKCMSCGGTTHAKGGQTDDLGNPTDPSVLKEMEVFIENEMPKLDEDRYFTYGMKRKEAKRRFYEKHGYGAYGMDLFAKGGYVRPKNLALPERHYQTLADAIDKVVDHYGKEEIKDYIERNGAQGRYAVYRQATNRIWMDDDNANLRGDRFGIKHDPDWRTRTRMYTDAHFDSATKSILKQKLGTKTMAKGGKTKRKEVSDFDKLAMKVASKYRGKAVPKKYQSKYGKRYDNEEAMEVGRAVASKVYRQQQAKKGKK